MIPAVSATFTYTRAEYVRALRRHYQWQLQLRRDVIASCAAIAGGVYLVQSEELVWLGWLLVTLGAVFLVMVTYTLFILPQLLYGMQPKLKSRYTLQFSEAGIEFKTDNIDSELQWPLFHSWRYDKEFYVLFYGKRDLTVVPRRALDETSDRHLRALLTQQLGSAA